MLTPRVMCVVGISAMVYTQHLLGQTVRFVSFSFSSRGIKASVDSLLTGPNEASFWGAGIQLSTAGLRKGEGASLPILLLAAAPLCRHILFFWSLCSGGHFYPGALFEDESQNSHNQSLVCLYRRKGTLPTID